MSNIMTYITPNAETIQWKPTHSVGFHWGIIRSDLHQLWFKTKKDMLRVARLEFGAQPQIYARYCDNGKWA